jgi:alkylation response protein AidB-like acyl-CoA dehydrogenase
MTSPDSSDTADATGELIESTARRVLQSFCAAEQLRSTEGAWSEPLWRELEASGLTQALEPAGKGELGVPIEAALAIVRLSGEYAAPVPLAESLLAHWIIRLTGLPAVQGPLSIAPVHPDDRLTLERVGSGWHLQGVATRVPWARYAKALVVCATHAGQDWIALVPANDINSVQQGDNLALEPRDRVVFDSALSEGTVVRFEPGGEYLFALGAAVRVVQMAGALDAVLQMTVQYVTHRKQFGRPLGKFQAIQQNIALMAANTAAAKAAANTVGRSFERTNAGLVAAAAKLRTNEAVSTAARLAHQAHGAIGFTREYPLHFLTKRLWSWRDEFGNETQWSRKLGDLALRGGPDRLWSLITSELG